MFLFLIFLYFERFYNLGLKKLGSLKDLSYKFWFLILLDFNLIQTVKCREAK